MGKTTTPGKRSKADMKTTPAKSGLTPHLRSMTFTQTSPSENKENIPPSGSRLRKGRVLFGNEIAVQGTNSTASASPARPQRAAKIKAIEINHTFPTGFTNFTPEKPPGRQPSKRTVDPPSDPIAVKCKSSPSSGEDSARMSTARRTRSASRAREIAIKETSTSKNTNPVLAFDTETLSEKRPNPDRRLTRQSSVSRSHGASSSAATVRHINGINFTPVKEWSMKMRLKMVDGNQYRIRTMNTPKTPATCREGTNIKTRQTPARNAKLRLRTGSDGDYEEEKAGESEEYESGSSEEDDGDESEEEEEDNSNRRRTRANVASCVVNGRRQGGGQKEEKVEKKKSTHTAQFESEKELETAPKTLAAALTRLSTTKSPRGILLCREEECAQIKDFIIASTKSTGRSQACYISGVPGTGKTASVLAMVEEVRSCRSAPPFVFIHVNAMYFTDSKQLFAEVLEEFLDQTDSNRGRRKKVAGATARRKLNSLFETVDRNRPAVLLLIDELDQLSTKKQELIYDIFNWTSSEASRVSVISIANTLDLPERMLNQRICSRLGMNRIVFQPYSHEEIIRIVQSKLGGTKAIKGRAVESTCIEADAVQFAARKVAAISGDLRKAVDILRGAVEGAVASGENTLTMRHVTESIRVSSSTLLVAAVSALPTHLLVLLDSAVEIVRTRDVEEFSLAELVEKYSVVVRTGYETEPVHEDALWRFLLQLSASSLIAFTNPNEARFRRKIKLVPAAHDAQSAIKIAVSSHKEREEKDGIPEHRKQFK